MPVETRWPPHSYNKSSAVPVATAAPPTAPVTSSSLTLVHITLKNKYNQSTLRKQETQQNIQIKINIMVGYYCIAGKVWQGESLANLVNCPWFGKIKPSKLVLTINNLLADLPTCQTFCHIFKKSKFAKLFSCQTFPLYSITTPRRGHDFSVTIALLCGIRWRDQYPSRWMRL